MTNLQRIKSVIIALLLLICAFLFIFQFTTSYAVLLILGISLIVSGIRSIIYYFSMARHMVDGMIILLKGILLLDIGIFTITLNDVPQHYIMVYLIILYLFNAVINILQGIEQKKMGAPWKIKFGYGLICVLISILCVVFFKSLDIMMIIYGVGLIYSAIARIITAFRRTGIGFVE